MYRRKLFKTLGALSVLPNIGFAKQNSLLLNQNYLPESSFPLSIMDASLAPSSGALEILSGSLPDDIYGHVFMAEGIAMENNHLTPNGRGALTRFDFSQNGVSFLRKMIDTPSAIMQTHIDTPLDRFSLLGATIYFSANLGFMNYCNTAPNYMGNNRFALSYEGGPPYEFDATTLELVTQIGNVNEWKTSLPPFVDWLTPDKWLFPQVRTTGHPYFDLDTGECITINYGGNMAETGLQDGFIRVIKWDQQGAFQTWQVIGRQGGNAYIVATSHSLGVTRNHILIFETAARMETSRMLGFRTVEPQQHRTPVWVIRKADLIAGQSTVIADYLELDFDTSDIMCEYDDSGNEITLYGQYLGAMDKSEPQFYFESLYFDDRVAAAISGYPAAPVDVGGLVRARIRVNPLSAEEIKDDFHLVRDQRICWDMNDPAYRGHFQFPEKFEHIYWAAIGYRPEHLVRRVAEAYENYPNRFYSNDTLPQIPMPSALIHFDCTSLSITDSYEFPQDCVMRTPQFMARQNSTGQDEGYLFTAVVRKYPTADNANGKEIWIFDAQNLAQGPICILAHPALNFATTNHALWVPRIGPRPLDAYRSDLAQYFIDRMDLHSSDVQQVLEDYILPKFG